MGVMVIVWIVIYPHSVDCHPDHTLTGLVLGKRQYRMLVILTIYYQLLSLLTQPHILMNA